MVFGKRAPVRKIFFRFFGICPNFQYLCSLKRTETLMENTKGENER